jgi:hypothetical protein
VTPVLANLHPSAVVDTLHVECQSDVKAQNKLKQEQSEKESVENNDEKFCKKKRMEADDEKSQNKKTSQLQLMFSLSRVRTAIIK